jgi:hypothetical protein
MSLQAQITALAQAIGFDVKTMAATNLPMDHIPFGVTKTIASGYQMPVYGAVEIDGVLDIQGKLVLT